jgi:chaperonin GroES
MMEIVTKTSQNKSGIFPCGNHVLVKPDVIEEKSKGGVVIPDWVIERHQQSVSYGYIIAVGPDYCKHSVEITERYIDGVWKPVERKTIKFSERFAEPGDRIAFAIYSGRECTGEDGEKYVLINDQDITAPVTEKVVATSIEAREPVSQ